MTKPLTGLLLMLAGLSTAPLASCASSQAVVPPHTGDVTEPSPAEPTTPLSPAAPPSSPAGRALLAQAEASSVAGDGTAARRVLQRLVREQPETVEGIRAGQALAKVALKHGHHQRAETLTREPPSIDAAPTLAFVSWTLRGRAMEGLERFEMAAQAYRQAIVAAGDDPAQKRPAVEGAARATLLAGDPTGAASVLEGSGDKTEALRKLVTPHLASAKALERLYGKVPTSSPWRAWVRLQQARKAMQAGDMVKANEASAEALTSQDPAVRREATAVVAEVAAWNTVKPRTVGVLLPLSGKYQRLGQAALEAIQLGLGPRSGIRLLVRDTKGDAAIAATLAKSLIMKDHVATLLGPIGEKESAAAAEVSHRLGVPHMVLSRHDAIGTHRGRVFRLRLSRVELGKALAQYAWTTLKIRRVAIVYPSSAHGFRQMASFWDEMVRLGGEVRAVASYAPGTTKFNPVIKALVGSRKSTAKRVDFEGLFVPDQALTVRRMVPFLKYWGIRLRTGPDALGTKKRPTVQLLGSQGWNHPTLIDPGEHLTDNAVFVTPFHDDPSDAPAHAFATAFKSRYAKTPTAFHAEVFDATRFLVRSVAKSIGMDHGARGEIATSLRTTANFIGATGPILLLGDNALVRAPQVLTVDLDKIRRRANIDRERELRKLRRADTPTVK